MTTELGVIHSFLQATYKKHVPPLQIRKDNDNVFEVAGTREAIQEKQKVGGFYFGSDVPKPNDIRLYYFPIFTHPEEFDNYPRY